MNTLHELDLDDIAKKILIAEAHCGQPQETIQGYIDWIRKELEEAEKTSNFKNKMLEVADIIILAYRLLYMMHSTHKTSGNPISTTAEIINEKACIVLNRLDRSAVEVIQHNKNFISSYNEIKKGEQ